MNRHFWETVCWKLTRPQKYLLSRVPISFSFLLQLQHESLG